MLQKDYILYLTGSLKAEPMQKREYLSKRIKILAGTTKLKPVEIFQAENLISKVHSSFRQWDKQLERKGLRIKRKIQSERETDQPIPAKTQTPSKTNRNNDAVRISDAYTQREQVVTLYDQYIQLMIKTGGSKQIPFGKFQGFIQAQTQKYRNRGAEAVRFEINEKAGKVVIKSRSS
jgi:arginyl-tRNA--protein-N-Asp/Glu arginylyltransferase